MRIKPKSPREALQPEPAPAPKPEPAPEPLAPSRVPVSPARPASSRGLLIAGAVGVVLVIAVLVFSPGEAEDPVDSGLLAEQQSASNTSPSQTDSNSVKSSVPILDRTQISKEKSIKLGIVKRVTRYGDSVVDFDASIKNWQRDGHEKAIDPGVTGCSFKCLKSIGP